MGAGEAAKDGRHHRCGDRRYPRRQVPTGRDRSSEASGCELPRSSASPCRRVLLAIPVTRLAVGRSNRRRFQMKSENDDKNFPFGEILAMMQISSKPRPAVQPLLRPSGAGGAKRREVGREIHSKALESFVWRKEIAAPGPPYAGIFGVKKARFAGEKRLFPPATRL